MWLSTGNVTGAVVLGTPACTTTVTVGAFVESGNEKGIDPGDCPSIDKMIFLFE